MYQVPPLPQQEVPGLHLGAQAEGVLANLEKECQQNRQVVLLLLRRVPAEGNPALLGGLQMYFL